MSNKEDWRAKIAELLDAAKEQHEYGGDYDDRTGLSPGRVDFEELKAKILALLPPE